MIYCWGIGSGRAGLNIILSRWNRLRRIYSNFNQLREERDQTDMRIIQWAEDLSDAVLDGDQTYISIVNPESRNQKMASGCHPLFQLPDAALRPVDDTAESVRPGLRRNGFYLDAGDGYLNRSATGWCTFKFWRSGSCLHQPLKRLRPAGIYFRHSVPCR